MKQESVMLVSVGTVDMQDSYYFQAEFTLEESTIFKPNQNGMRPMEFDNLHWFGVTYEMSLNKDHYTRTVYSSLDWLSDIGGISTAISAMFGLLIKVLMYQEVDFYLISKLYKRKHIVEGKTSDDETVNSDDEKDTPETEKTDESDEYLSLDRINMFKVNICRFMPEKLRCKRLIRKEEQLFI